MSGNYPDVPGPRMAYDRDGSVVTFYNVPSGGITEQTVGNRQILNDESTGGVFLGTDNAGARHYSIYFPELRDIVGLFIRRSGSNGGPSITGVEWSADSSNPTDGTWTAVAFSDPGDNSIVSPAYRTIPAWVASGVKAIRVKFNFTGSGGGTGVYLNALHVYGNIAAAQNPNRLRFWHPTTDAEITGPHFDLAEQARGATATVAFRIKNNSSTLTANSIGITREALTDTSPTNVGQVEFSTDNLTFASSISIGNLAPGALSSVLYTRRTTSVSAVIGAWAVRFIATATTWA